MAAFSIRAVPLFAALAVVGCATTLRPPSQVPTEAAQPADLRQVKPPQQDKGSPEAEPAGVFHVVRAGQTLWRISRVYGVPVEQLVAVNRLDEPTQIVEGRSLFIPGARTPLDVPVFPSRPVEPLLPAPVPPSMDSVTSDLFWPVAGGEILSGFADPRRKRRHEGLDIRGARGQEIFAAADGQVVFSGNSGNGYGRMVVLDHGNGLKTLYAHDEKVLVSRGDVVTRGQPIARVGRTGNATTEHCHFEVRLAETPVDPLPLLRGTVEARR